MQKTQIPKNSHLKSYTCAKNPWAFQLCEPVNCPLNARSIWLSFSLLELEEKRILCFALGFEFVWFWNRVSCPPDWLWAHCVAEADTELLIPLPLCPKCCTVDVGHLLSSEFWLCDIMIVWLGKAALRKTAWSLKNKLIQQIRRLSVRRNKRCQDLV